MTTLEIQNSTNSISNSLTTSSQPTIPLMTSNNHYLVFNSPKKYQQETPAPARNGLRTGLNPYRPRRGR